MKEIPLTQGKVALVDDEDFEKVSQFQWYANRIGKGDHWYATRNVRRNGKRRPELMHRVIMGLEYGDPRQVDHRDRVNTLDNRKCNLRVATRPQNSRNIGVPKHNTSGFKGVSWRKQDDKWGANIKVNGVQRYLGSFPTKELAAVAYDAAAIELHGEFACTNEMLAAQAA